MPKIPKPWLRVENPTERVCKTCHILKPIVQFPKQTQPKRGQDWFTYRHSCIGCERTKSLDRYYAKQILGNCSHCGTALITPGYMTCEECRAKNKTAKDNSTILLRALVLCKYGRRCVHCGDTRVECLEIDHVGGWGKEHLAETGERLRGYGLWVWIRDSGFPNSVRLLCGSCHSALSYFGRLPRLSITGGTLPLVAPLPDVQPASSVALAESP